LWKTFWSARHSLRLVALARRYITKPPRLDVSGHSRLDATIILVWILLIMCAMFGQNAANIGRGVQAAADKRVVSHALASFLAVILPIA